MNEFPWNPQLPGGVPQDQLDYLRKIIENLTQPNPPTMRGATMDTTMWTPQSVARNFGIGMDQSGNYENPAAVANIYGSLINRQPQIEYAQPAGTAFPAENLQAAGALENLYQSQAQFPGQMQMQQVQIGSQEAQAEYNRARAQDPYGVGEKQAQFILKSIDDVNNQITELSTRAEQIRRADDTTLTSLFPESPDPGSEKRRSLTYIDAQIRALQERLRRYEMTMGGLGRGRLAGAYTASAETPTGDGGTPMGIPSLADLIGR